MSSQDNGDELLRRISDAVSIAIIDADLVAGGTRHPNLAVMKMSGYCKLLGKHPILLFGETAYKRIADFDLVLISKVFSFSATPEGLDGIANAVIGGTGFFEDGGPDLPEEIEHCFPDYDIYNDYVDAQIRGGRPRSWFADYLDYSIGFLTRGCFRKCEFCVNKKYSKAIPHSSLEEFVDDTRPYIYLWDDNFFACSNWENLMQDLIDKGKPFQFRQGLDIRLLTEKKAKCLSRVKYRGDMIFAFDHIEDKDLIIEKLKLWRTYSSRGTRLYVLCAYDSQDFRDIETTFERIKILMKYGCLPYIMRFESYKDSRWRGLYTQLARWCNQPQFFKKKSFRQFCEANQEYAKSDKPCSALRAMVDFENVYPDIAKRFFDLRYEEENMFGERFCYYFLRHSQDCGFCEGSQVQWKEIIDQNDIATFIRAFLLGNLGVECLERPNNDCMIETQVAVEFTVGALLNSSMDYCLGILGDDKDAYQFISPANIPQFSNLDDALYVVAEVVDRFDTGLTFDELGTFLDSGAKKNDTARKKYGENHGKLAAQLGLVSLTKDGADNWLVGESPMTSRYLALDRETRMKFAAFLMLRIPVIRSILRDAIADEITVDDYLYPLSQTTAKRRKSNVIALLKHINKWGGGGHVAEKAFSNIGELS